MWGWITALLAGIGEIFTRWLGVLQPEKKEVVDEGKNTTSKSDDELLADLGLKRMPETEGNNDLRDSENGQSRSNT